MQKESEEVTPKDKTGEDSAAGDEMPPEEQTGEMTAVVEGWSQ